jgi:hypothetical protein
MELVNAITTASVAMDWTALSRLVAPDSENEPETDVPDSIRKTEQGMSQTARQ